MASRDGTGDDQLTDDEIARRMERGLRKALNTPPQPHGKNPRSPPYTEAEGAARIKRARSQGQDWPLESLQTQETVLQRQATFLPRWRRFRTCRQQGQFIRAGIKVRDTV
jgi:hypothetical protein